MAQRQPDGAGAYQRFDGQAEADVRREAAHGGFGADDVRLPRTARGRHGAAVPAA